MRIKILVSVMFIVLLKIFSANIGTLANPNIVTIPLQQTPLVERYRSAKSIAIDGNGDIFFIENKFFEPRTSSQGNRVMKLLPNGKAQVVAGNGIKGFNGDNILAVSASLSGAANLTIDNKNNLLIADARNNRLRQIDLTTGIITTLAGKGSVPCDPVGCLTMGDGNLATEAFNLEPSEVIVDKDNNLFILEGRVSCLRYVDAKTGIIDTLFGQCNRELPRVCRDASEGSLCSPIAMTYKHPFLYFVEPETNTIRRYDIEAKKLDILIFGDKVCHELCHPTGIAVDNNENLFISQSVSIKKLDIKTGQLTTVAGKNSNRIYSGDDGPASQAGLIAVSDIAIDKDENIIFTDDNRIRRIDAKTGIITTIAGIPGTVVILKASYQKPLLTVQGFGIDEIDEININGQVVKPKSFIFANESMSFKGSKKKLNLKSGKNIIVLSKFLLNGSKAESLPFKFNLP
ncbi:MAG: hypothetical protein WAQ98_13195 [Blastocatellia bacterium]